MWHAPCQGSALLYSDRSGVIPSPSAHGHARIPAAGTSQRRNSPTRTTHLGARVGAACTLLPAARTQCTCGGRARLHTLSLWRVLCWWGLPAARRSIGAGLARRRLLQTKLRSCVRFAGSGRCISGSVLASSSAHAVLCVYLGSRALRSRMRLEHSCTTLQRLNTRGVRLDTLQRSPAGRAEGSESACEWAGGGGRRDLHD